MSDRPRLRTHRLEMLPFDTADFEVFVDELVMDPAVMHYWWAYRDLLGREQRRERALEDFLTEWERAESSGYVVWVMRLHSPLIGLASPMVGWCGVLHADPSLEEHGPQVEYMLARAFQRQGLATEAVAATVADAFERYGEWQLHAVVDEPNAPSRRLLERLGFADQGQVSVYGSDEMVLYTIGAMQAPELRHRWLHER
jgi:ribosomal-protein-alanine N-acetyltransferase